jgi:hypothetical protein
LYNVVSGQRNIIKRGFGVMGDSKIWFVFTLYTLTPAESTILHGVFPVPYDAPVITRVVFPFIASVSIEIVEKISQAPSRGVTEKK